MFQSAIDRSVSLLVAALLAASVIMATPAAAAPNTCTAKQIQSPAGAKCIDKNLGLGDMRYVLYCSSTGKLLCCELDDKGNIKDHSCAVAELRALVPAVRISIPAPGRPPAAATPGILETGPVLPMTGPGATGTPLGGGVTPPRATSGPSLR